ncbi:MAG: hypothetical protein JOZ55_06000, partial [Alphaproteobacteria bacterium]|nr:hypothetical protein [Alphaproteobacteria bacterium]
MNGPLQDLPLRRELGNPVGAYRAVLSRDALSFLGGLAQVVDGIALLCVGWLSLISETYRGDDQWRTGIVTIVLGAVLATRLLKGMGAYDSFERRTNGVGLSAISVCLTLALLSGILWLGGASLAASRSWLQPWLLGSLAAMAFARLCYMVLISRWRRHCVLGRRIAVIGSGALAVDIIQSFSGDDQTVIAGVYDEQPVVEQCAGYAVSSS